MLTIWDVARGHKRSQWSAKGAILTGVKPTADAEYEASMVVSSSHKVVLLRLDDLGSLHQIHSTDLCPVAPILTKQAIPTTTSSKSSPRPPSSSSVPTPITLSAAPPHPIRIATHCYGCWVDGTSATPTSTLIRSETENPWSWKLNSLVLYSCSSSRPTVVSKISPRHGALQCTGVILGKCAATGWIIPQDRAMASHEEEHDCREIHISVVVPRPLSPKAKRRV
ncbi:hypothetical protein EDD18DRAFT_1467721 [Armillaria luteobubalina]|uniref:Uncharacterized protein n=1 Tax=Armillaria luteobubalina TaxID=153913 RepID=A0AA39PEX4_9AGAR|nr:hypothetical protein EDD18DRAFT_1467721 [Armillaria luteobubalina]